MIIKNFECIIDDFNPDDWHPVLASDPEHAAVRFTEYYEEGERGLLDGATAVVRVRNKQTGKEYKFRTWGAVDITYYAEEITDETAST